MEREDAAGGGFDADVKVLFHTGKKEKDTPKKGYKQLNRKLKNGYGVEEHTTLDPTVFNVKNAGIAVFAGSRERFRTNEFEIIERFIVISGFAVKTPGQFERLVFRVHDHILMNLPEGKFFSNHSRTRS